jgi:cell division protein ZipA
MEIELRVILLAVGMIIIMVVAFDLFKRKPEKMRRSKIDPNEISVTRSATLEPLLEPVVNHIVDPALDLYEASAMEAFPSEDEYPEEEISVIDEEEIIPENITPETIITISLMARDEDGFEGKVLLNAIQNANLHFGVYDVFHRFSNDDGTGEELFSLVKAVEPGYFYFETLENDLIPGVTLILLPERVSDPVAAFDKLVRTAKQLAFAVNGELLDHMRQPLTTATIEKYRELAQIKNERHQFAY